jgi:hypothetical protein
MAIAIRYFSTAAAGSENGIGWDNRAALFTAGNWSSVITEFNFSGSDSLECRIGPGSYTWSQSLASASFANPPTAANPLTLQGADGAGNRLAPPDSAWTSDQPPFSVSSLPLIATTTSNVQINLYHCVQRMLQFTSTVVNSHVVRVTALTEWCYIETSQSNTSTMAVLVDNGGLLANSVIRCVGTTYPHVANMGQGVMDNVRIIGPAGSSGGRIGVRMQDAVSASNGLAVVTRCTVVGVGGIGFAMDTPNQFLRNKVVNCVAVNCGGAAFAGSSAASQSLHQHVLNCVGVNCNIGVDAVSSRMVVLNSRFRDNALGDFANMGNYPTDLDNYTTDADDAADFVDAAAGNYQIKSTAGFAGRNIGVSQQSSGGGPSTRWGPVRELR